MNLNIFRDKLLALSDEDKLSNKEKNYILSFKNDKELLDVTLSLSNDTSNRITNPIEKDILNKKQVAQSFWSKILNQNI